MAPTCSAAGERVHVIPHGAFAHLTRQRVEEPLPPELAAVEGPVVLHFGVIRPYKGADVLVEAFQRVEGAELWVVGRPLEVSMEHLRRLAPPGRVRFVDRYVSDAELPAYFRRADLLVLPHRSVDMSGRAVRGPRLRQGDGAERRRRLSRDRPRITARACSCRLETRRRWQRRSTACWPTRRSAARLEERAAAAAAGPFSWDRIAEQTASLYEQVSS